jgi:hypothetical protein
MRSHCTPLCICRIFRPVFIPTDFVYDLRWLVSFGQTPDHAVALGAVIVVASGMFLLWREMRTKVSSVL